MEDYEYQNPELTSAFNDANLSIQRLNDSWVLCKRHIRNGNLKAWKIELDNIWMELYPDVLKKKDMKEELIIRNDSYMAKISESKNKTSMYFNIMARHLFLRELQDIAGKAGMYREEEDDFEAFE